MRDIIFVLGMHRSGTSAVTRICSLLGAQLPETLMGATESNPKGHWESDSIVSFNNRKLEARGTSWFDLPSWNSLRSLGVEFEASQDEFLALLNSEYPQKNIPIVLKDPRISLLLPEYITAVSKSKSIDQIKAILCVRSPIEVAASLYERDNLDQYTAQMVWLVYMLYAERGSRNVKRTIYHHSNLFSERPFHQFMSKTNPLDIDWPEDRARARKAIEDFIAPNLYRQKAEASNVAKIPIVDTAYQAFVDLANDRNVKAALSILDNCFDEIDPVLSASITIRHSVQSVLNDTQKALVLVEKEKNIARANLEDLREQFANLHNISETRTKESNQSLKSMTESLEATTVDLTQAKQKILTLEQSEANLEHSFEDLQSQMEQLEKDKSTELGQLSSALETAHQKAAHFKHSFEDLQSQMEQFEKDKSTELGQLSSALETAHQKAAHFKHSFEDLQSQMEQLEKDSSSKLRRMSNKVKKSLRREADLKHSFEDLQLQMKELEANKNAELDRSRTELDQVKTAFENDLGELRQDLKNEKSKFLQQSLVLKEAHAFAEKQHAISDDLNQKLRASLLLIENMKGSIFWKLRDFSELVLGFPKSFLQKNILQKSDNLRANSETEILLHSETIREWLVENEGLVWNEDSDNGLTYNVDNISLSEGVMHVWGWAFHKHAQTIKVDVLSLGWNGHVDIFTVESAKARKDVEMAFGGPNSLLSGFSFLGSWGRQFKEMPREVAIVIRLRGTNDQLIPVKCFERTLNKNINDNHPNFGKYLRWKFSNALSLVRRGDFKSLAKGGHRVLKREFGNTDEKIDNNKVLTLTKKALNNGAQFIIDHSLGGGCNSYTRDLTKKIFEEGRDVVILSFSVGNLSWTIQVLLRNGDSSHYDISNGISILNDLAPELSSIFLNNIVSFPQPEFFISSLTEIIEDYNISLTIAFHDQYAVCPSHFLLNSEGRFCDVPEMNVCETCLSRNPFGFTSLAESNDVAVWRQKWSKLILSAENLLFFSDASLALVRKAHPNMKQSVINVKPHSIDVSDWEKPSVPIAKPLKIGVVGSLSHHKGSEVVIDIANEIEKRGLDIEIHIIGELNTEKHSGVTTTGPFNRDQIPRLVEASDVNMFLMPSIVPETFSYVTAELMAIEFPVVCFNFGAPAERVQEYKLGLVIPQGTPSEILDAIMRFYEKIKNT